VRFIQHVCAFVSGDFGADSTDFGFGSGSWVNGDFGSWGNGGGFGCDGFFIRSIVVRII
jgi:hypothetical protein